MNQNIDFERLRNDLMDEYGAQMVSATGLMGFSGMMDASRASEEELLDMARREGIDLSRYYLG